MKIAKECSAHCECSLHPLKAHSPPIDMPRVVRASGWRGIRAATIDDLRPIGEKIRPLGFGLEGIEKIEKLLTVLSAEVSVTLEAAIAAARAQFFCTDELSSCV